MAIQHHCVPGTVLGAGMWLEQDKVSALRESSDIAKRLEKRTRVVIIRTATEALLCSRYCTTCFLSPCNNSLRSILQMGKLKLGEVE